MELMSDEPVATEGIK